MAIRNIFFACNKIPAVVKLTSEKVKGIKGMQQRLVSLLTAGVLLAVFGTALDLTLGGLGGEAKADPPRTLPANVAVLVPEAPNVAYLDPDAEPIELISIIQGIPESVEREFRERRIVSLSPTAPAKKKSRPLELGELKADEKFSPGFASAGTKTSPARAPLFPVAVEHIPEEPLSPPADIDDNPFGVLVAETLPEARRFLETPNRVEFSSVELAQAVQSSADKRDINFDARRTRQKSNPFAKTLGNVKPQEAAPAAPPAPRSALATERNLSSLAPTELRREFERTFLSENQFLSPMETPEAAAPAGSRSPAREIVELSSGPMMVGGREVLQMKLEFGPDSAAVTSESVNIIRSFSQIATADPGNAIEIAISDKVIQNPDLRRLAARRFAIVANIMRSSGVAERQILPRLASRDEHSFIFSVIDSEAYTAPIGPLNAWGESEGGSTKTFGFRRW